MFKLKKLGGYNIAGSANTDVKSQIQIARQTYGMNEEL